LILTVAKGIIDVDAVTGRVQSGTEFFVNTWGNFLIRISFLIWVLMQQGCCSLAVPYLLKLQKNTLKFKKKKGNKIIESVSGALHYRSY
jgi:hypothetical protein